MKDTKLSRIKLIFVIGATLLVLIYVYFVAPTFTADIDKLRAENKQIEHDLSEVNAIGSDTTIIKSNIGVTKGELEQYEKRADLGSSTFDILINDIGKKEGITITNMDVEEYEAVGDKNSTGKVLCRQPVAISIECDFEDGLSFIKALEKSEEGLFNVKDFLYSEGKNEKDKENWMISVDVYFYEDK